jgi:PleD family two-component response regulator
MAVHTRCDLDAYALFDAVRTSIALLEKPHSGNWPHGVVTASMGLSSFVGPRDADEVFRAADTALYRGKSEGRNRIAWADPI